MEDNIGIGGVVHVEIGEYLDLLRHKEILDDLEERGLVDMEKYVTDILIEKYKVVCDEGI